MGNGQFAWRASVCRDERDDMEFFTNTYRSIQQKHICIYIYIHLYMFQFTFVSISFIHDICIYIHTVHFYTV